MSTFANTSPGHLPPHWAQRKITPTQADEIRRRYADGETAIGLAAEFGVSIKTIALYSGSRRGL